MRDIRTEDEVFDLSYHPSLPLFAAGLITGELQLYRLECRTEAGQRRQEMKDSTDRQHRDKRRKSAADAEQDDEDDGEQRLSSASAAGGDDSLEAESSQDGATLHHPDCFASPPLLYQCCPHTASIRSLTFSPSGSRLYTVSSDQSVSVFAVSPSASSPASPLTLLTSIPAAHSTAINVVRAWAGSGGDMLATGDDDGFVRVWDTRLWNRGQVNDATRERERGSNGAETGKRGKRRRRTGQSDEVKAAVAQATTAAMSFAESGDYISDICVDVGSHKLLCTSGDGHLQVFDLRRAGKWFAQSEGVEDDLLSVIVIEKKSGRGGKRAGEGGAGESGGEDRRKVVVGSKESGVRIFSWGWFGLPDSHFAFAESADVVLELPSPSAYNLLCIGSSEGSLSLCSLWPHRTLHRIGRHAGGQPVESACLSGRVSAGGGQQQQEESQWLISAGHDRRIRMWDMTAACDEGWTVSNEQDEEEEEVEEEEELEEAGEQEDEEDDGPSQDEAEAATATAATSQSAADSDDDEEGESGVAVLPASSAAAAGAAPPALSQRAAAGLKDRAQLVAFLKRRMAAAKEQKVSEPTTQQTEAENTGADAGDGKRNAAVKSRREDKRRDKKKMKAERKQGGGGGRAAGSSSFFDGL
jgi:WD40 repeat protein